MGVRLNLRERMISLERLLMEAGYHGSGGLQKHFTSKWLDGVLGEMVVLEERRRP